jgi:hypothetical protein
MEKDLINIYAEWRECGENCDAPFTWDCGEKSAREDFSSYAELEEEITFEDMLELEQRYKDVDIRCALHKVMTFAEATEKWGLADSTLRKLVTTDKLTEGVDYRKSGKVWIITEEAMIKIYGEPKET